MKRTILTVLSAFCDSLAACSGVSGFSRSLASPSFALSTTSRPGTFPRRGVGRPFPAGRRGPAVQRTASSYALRLVNTDLRRHA
jgi:predicted small secreted protein